MAHEVSECCNDLQAMQHMLQGGFTVERLQRWGHSMVQRSNTLYVFGGYGGAGAHRRLNDLIAIDTPTASANEPTITGTQPAKERVNTPGLPVAAMMFTATILMVTSMHTGAVGHR